MGKLIENLEHYFMECISDEVNYVNDWINSGWVGNFHLDMILTHAINVGASDIHIEGGQYVRFTVLGEIMTYADFPIPDEDIMIDLINGMLNNEQRSYFIRDLEYDCSYRIRFGPYTDRRFRVNIGKSFGYNMMTLRTISDKIPTLDDLGISENISNLFQASSGITLVCGPTGSGKALHQDTFIPTIQGGKRLKDIQIGDICFDEKGQLTKVTDKYSPKDTQNFYEILLSDCDIIRSADCHLWEVLIDDEEQVIDTTTLYHDYYLKDKMVFIKRTQPVQYPKITTQIKPYEYGTLTAYYSEKGVYVSLGKSYLYNDITTRLEVLAGFSDTLGNIGYQGEIELKIKNKSLAKEIRQLICSLGFKCSHLYSLGYAFMLTYYPTIKVPLECLKDTKIFEREPYQLLYMKGIFGRSEQYFCLGVDAPSHLFLCGYDYIPTHNTNTLASIINDIQTRLPKKIITVENPIEFVYPQDKKGLIVQRAIPEDCLSFGDGLTSAMRSAPNIILIGEVRNKKEVDELLRASETGHLAVSTIHTSNNVTTLNRIRSLYDGEEQKRILSTLGDNLRGIINQTLVKTFHGQSRFAIREVLAVDFQIRKLISEDKIKEIRQYQESTKQTMEHLLIEAVVQGKCYYEEAYNKAPDPTYFEYLWGSYGYSEYQKNEQQRIIYQQSELRQLEVPKSAELPLNLKDDEFDVIDDDFEEMMEDDDDFEFDDIF